VELSWLQTMPNTGGSGLARSRDCARRFRVNVTSVVLPDESLTRLHQLPRSTPRASEAQSISMHNAGTASWLPHTANPVASRRRDKKLLTASGTRCNHQMLPLSGVANATLHEARHERPRLLDSRIHAMSGRWLLHGFFYLKVSWIAWPKLTWAAGRLLVRARQTKSHSVHEFVHSIHDGRRRQFYGFRCAECF